MSKRTPAAQGTVASWKLVPVNPTPEMQRAYFDEIDRNMERVLTDLRFGRFDNHKLAYQAMLAAAPSPSPEALPASGVEAREALFRDLLAFAADRAALDPTFAKGFEKQVIADARALVARAAALSSAPAPEDR